MKKILGLIITAAVILTMAACSNPVYKESYVSQAANLGESTTSHGEVEDKSLEQKARDRLYPAYITESGLKKWGYINKEGRFIVSPEYDWIWEFNENKPARVSRDGKMALIDSMGRLIVEPEYDFIYEFSEGLATLYKDKQGYIVIDENGQKIFESMDFVGEFHNGLALLSRKTGDTVYTYGYVDKEGKTVIEPLFEKAEPFNNNKAVVKLKEGKYALIDETGKIIKQFSYKTIQGLSEEILIYTDEKDMKGYIKLDGEKITDAKFYQAEPFKDGFAIVNISEDFSAPKHGVINKKGEFVIKPEYATVSYLGEGMFAASEKALYSTNDAFVKKAILNSEGEKVTDFKYYDIGKYSKGLVSVSEDLVTYFIDKEGQRVKGLPEVDGPGTMKIFDDLIKADIDLEVVYLTNDGKVIWKPQREQELAGGIIVKTIKYRPDRCMLINYPEFSGMTDKVVESKLNAELKDKFAGKNPVSLKEDGMYAENIDKGFNVRSVKDLVVLEKNGYYYPIGAAHGMPIKEYYHINLKTGKSFTLPDLFEKDSDYLARIRDIINRQIEIKSKDEDSMLLASSVEEIKPDQQFIVTEKSLKVFFQPYEIAAYAAGFPEFDIPYSEIMDIINTEGELWNLFN